MTRGRLVGVKLMVESTVRPGRKPLVVAVLSGVVNTAVAVWFVVGEAMTQRSRPVDVLREPASAFLAVAILMAVFASIAALGVARGWRRGAVIALEIPPFLWLGLLAIGALAVTIFGPV